ncbi:MAG: hypothetical protein WA797_04000, partial [Acidimicrobiales bacterium]
IAEGVVTAAQAPKRRAGHPVKSKGTVSDLVANQVTLAIERLSPGWEPLTSDVIQIFLAV